MTSREWLEIFGGALFAFLFLCTVAFAEQPVRLPAGVTCSMVREKVSEHGKVYAYAWARMQGYSSAEISQAKRCLK